MTDKKIDLRGLFHSLQDELHCKLKIASEHVHHPTAKGEASEIPWIDVLRAYLPERYRVEGAFVVDSRGDQSEQQDVVIFDRQYSPFILNREGALFVPAESVYAVIEVKQNLNRDHVEYAGKKAASVRRLHRTSVSICHAGGKFPPKAPFPISAGLITLTSDWSPPLGDPFVDALTSLPSDRRLDFGCALAGGAFAIDCPPDGDQMAVRRSRPEAALMSFLFNVFRTLQQLGTVPAVDVLAYARWLDE